MSNVKSSWYHLKLSTEMSVGEKKMWKTNSESSQVMLGHNSSCSEIIFSLQWKVKSSRSWTAKSYHLWNRIQFQTGVVITKMLELNKKLASGACECHNNAELWLDERRSGDRILSSHWSAPAQEDMYHGRCKRKRWRLTFQPSDQNKVITVSCTH